MVVDVLVVVVVVGDVFDHMVGVVGVCLGGVVVVIGDVVGVVCGVSGGVYVVADNGGGAVVHAGVCSEVDVDVDVDVVGVVHDDVVCDC